MAEEVKRPEGAIDITTLSLQELEKVKEGLESDLEYLSRSRGALVTAANGYQGSKDTLAAVAKENEGRAVLVPITSSISSPLHPTPLTPPLASLSLSLFL